MTSFSYKIGHVKKNSDNTFNRLYVFGDSLSDPGNIFNTSQAANNILNSINPALAELFPIQPPVPPYDSQGKFTNGNPADPSRSIWVDFLADDLNLDGSVAASTSLTVTPDPSFLPPVDPSLFPAVVFNTNTSVVETNFNYGGQTANQSVNFAFVGAKTGADNIFNPDPIPPNPPLPGLNPDIPGVSAQIDSFLNDVGTLQPAQTSELENALYSIWAGANDIDPDLSGSIVDLNQSVDNIETNIKKLYDGVGARNFIVFNVPDLGDRPLVTDPNVAQILTNASQAYNELLIQKIGDLDTELPDVNITPIDFYSLQEFTIDNPAAFGLTNTEDAFLISATIGENPDEYFSWDGNHPTRAVHEITGEFVFQNLQATSNREDAFIVGDRDTNILIGGFGDDKLYAAAGNDLLLGGFGDDKLNGGWGDDLLNGGVGNDKLNGGFGNDKLNGSIGNDRLNGGFGKDQLNGGIGDDSLNGGWGEDTYIFGSDLLDAQADVDTIHCLEVNDILDFSGFLSAGGSIDWTRDSQNSLRINLNNLSNGIGDVVNIFGSQTALSGAEAILSSIG